MKRQFAIFLVALLVLAAVGLTYGPKVAADLFVLRPITIDAPGTKIVLRPEQPVGMSPEARRHYLLDAQRVVTHRLQLLQPIESSRVMLEQGQLKVVLSGRENMAHLVNIISRVGEVEFVDGGLASPPVGQRIQTGSDTIPAQNLYQTLFTGAEIAEIIPPDSDTGYIFYQITPQPAAAKRVAQFLDRRVTEYICLVIDKEVTNCSKMYYWSGNTLDILPNLNDNADVNLADLAIFLKSGPLPLSLKVVTN
jgi:hypothetical protein